MVCFGRGKMLNPWLYIKAEPGTLKYAQESLRYYLSEGMNVEIRNDKGWYYIEFKDVKSNSKVRAAQLNVKMGEIPKNPSLSLEYETNPKENGFQG